ncbi:ATP-binding protein [Halothiobacillus sp. DCM-1]|uniref:sensor histidine kinase n=1 Tax=Halothiobacillus sp. DCM-1 TaxID=3112558 RepID=UPI003247DB3F
MRLPVNIFLWTFGATLLPVLALVWGVTAVSEHRFQAEVNRELSDNIQSLTGEINNRLRYEREVVRGIALSQPIQTMLNALIASAQGIRHPELTAERIRANSFLAGLQRTVPGLGSIRILDAAGNTVVKTTLGRAAPPMFESLSQMNYVEAELENPGFLAKLKSLPLDEVSFLMLPSSLWDTAPGQLPSMLYAVYPLRAMGNERAGYVVLNTYGEYLDQILSLSPRPRLSHIMVIEHDPGHAMRDGLVLYDDKAGRLFVTPMEANPSTQPSYAQAIDDGRFWQAIVAQSDGVFVSRHSGQRWYFQEYHPYPNSLVSWFIVLGLPEQVTSAPFADIHRSLWGFALLALGLSLLLAGLGARYFSRPISRLGKSLKSFADGNRALGIPVDSRTTEVRQLQQSFRYLTTHLNREEALRQRAERQMLQQAKLASVGEMAAGIGHEINNPLNNILALTALIERQLRPEQTAVQRDVVDLRAEAERISHIVRGVMNFARQLPPDHETVAIEPWLSELIDRLQPEAMAADLFLDLSPVKPDCTASFDPNQIGQVVINLVRNAMHASPRDGHISITAECAPETLRVVVEDQGGGIRQEVIEQIFDPFFTTKPVDKGTGLGLSISLGIVQYHGGQLVVQNRVDQPGVRAVIDLPRAKSSPKIGQLE